LAQSLMMKMSQVTVSESEEDSQVGEVDEMDNRYSATDVDADDSDFDGSPPRKVVIVGAGHGAPGRAGRQRRAG